MKLSISSLLLLASLAWIGRVNSVVFDVVKQYNECKELTMIEYTDSWQDYYYPDPTVENNYLEDSFYEGLGLGDMSLNDALDYMQAIYSEMALDSDLERCVNKRPYNYYATSGKSPLYSAFFSDDNLPSVKDIISALDAALADDLRSRDELQWFWGFGNGVNLPTLTNFSYVAEYSNLRAYEYKTFYDCFSHNYSTWLSCSYNAKVDSDAREIRNDQTEDYIQNMLLCSMVSLKNCIREKKVFYGLVTWAEIFSDLDLSGVNLASYFEGLADTADNLELEEFDSVYLSVWDKTAYYKAYKTSWSQTDVASLGTYPSLLTSNELSVSAEIKSGPNDQTTFSKVIISDNNGANFEFDDCDVDKLQNSTILNNNGEVAFQIIVYDYSQYNYYYLEVYHFSSKSVININKSYLMISSPTSALDNSSGILIDGPPQNENSNSKMVNKFECKTMCKNLAKSTNHLRSAQHFAIGKSIDRCMTHC